MTLTKKCDHTKGVEVTRKLDTYTLICECGYKWSEKVVEQYPQKKTKKKDRI